MRIDISEKRIERAIDAMRALENMDFPEIIDSNKMDKLYRIMCTLADFSYDLEEWIL